MEPSAAAAAAVLLRNGGGGGGKDSRWLTLEVCPDFLAGDCQKSEEECKSAHPQSHVEIQNGHVTCCYDSIKGKCSRTNPPCKYLHPPEHLRKQLLETGRQHLILKNLQVQSATMATGLQQMISMPGAMVPCVFENGAIKQVMPSNFQTMVLPGPHPFMQPSVAQPYAFQGSPGLPYQYIAPQPSNPYSGRIIQMVGPSGGTFPFSTQQGPAALPIQTASLFPGAGIYGGPQMATIASPLTMASQMELCVMPDGTYAYQTSSWGGPLGSNDVRQILPAANNSAISSVAYSDTASTSVSDSTSPSSSYSLATASLGAAYQTPVAYQMAQVLDATSSNSRKRTIMAAAGGTSGLLPMMKRPAMVDAKTGLPVYQPIAATSPYQQMAYAALSPHQYIPISVANNHAMMPHFQ